MKISKNASPEKNLIGEQVRKLRKARGLAQKDMSEELKKQGRHMSDLTILRIEKGQRMVTDIELKMLCEYFHVTPNFLMGFNKQS